MKKTPSLSVITIAAVCWVVSSFWTKRCIAKLTEEWKVESLRSTRRGEQICHSEPMSVCDPSCSLCVHLLNHLFEVILVGNSKLQQQPETSACPKEGAGQTVPVPHARKPTVFLEHRLPNSSHKRAQVAWKRWPRSLVNSACSSGKLLHILDALHQQTWTSPQSTSRLPWLHGTCHNRVTAWGGQQWLGAGQPGAQDLSDHQNEAQSFYSPCPVKRFCGGPGAAHPASASTSAGTEKTKQTSVYLCETTERSFLFSKKYFNQTFGFHRLFVSWKQEHLWLVDLK